MSDQDQNQKPVLSLEEELDVLEAVYKVGKEKGLDLLRPEQIKKLMESGRMESSSNQLPDDNKTMVGEKGINFIVDYLEMDARKQWEAEFGGVNLDDLTSGDRKGLLSDYFAYKYGMRAYDLREMLMVSMGGNHA